MITQILLGLAALVVVFLIVAALQPATFRVVRTMKLTIDGSPAGVGAKYAWLGNNKVGEGRMAITDSRPNELVAIKLEFIKPFAATNTTEFVFRPEGGKTHVTWSMAGEKNFMSKACGLIMNMDKMIGRDFEKGLAQLAAASEAGAKATV